MQLIIEFAYMGNTFVTGGQCPGPAFSSWSAYFDWCCDFPKEQLCPENYLWQFTDICPDCSARHTAVLLIIFKKMLLVKSPSISLCRDSLKFLPETTLMWEVLNNSRQRISNVPKARIEHLVRYNCVLSLQIHLQLIHSELQDWVVGVLTTASGQLRCEHHKFYYVFSV